MHLAGHESAVSAHLGGLLAGSYVPSPVRDGRLDPKPRRPSDVSQVQRVRLGSTPHQPRLCHSAADARDQ